MKQVSTTVGMEDVLQLLECTDENPWFGIGMNLPNTDLNGDEAVIFVIIRYKNIATGFIAEFASASFEAAEKVYVAMTKDLSN